MVKRLEISFIKTYLRERHFYEALKTMFLSVNRNDYGDAK